MASVSRWCPQCTEPQGGPGPHSARTSDWSPPPQVQGLQGAGVCIWAMGSCTHTSGRTSPAHRGPCQSDESARALRPGTKLWRHLQARRRAGAPAPDQGFASHTLQGVSQHICFSLTARPVWPLGGDRRTSYPRPVRSPSGGTRRAHCPQYVGASPAWLSPWGGPTPGAHALGTHGSTWNSSGLCPWEAAQPMVVRLGREACRLHTG